MREGPIVMSGESVRAIFAGSKTETRRALRPQPPRAEQIRPFLDRPGLFRWRGPLEIAPGVELVGGDLIRCPHGAPGDRLWVKEALRGDGQAGGRRAGLARYAADGAMVIRDDGLYRGDVPWPWARPTLSPIFMPRWASRLTLEIVAVRAERVQDIDTDGLRAEGLRHTIDDGPILCDEYARMWDGLNAKRGFPWASNPWVFVIAFRRV